MLDDADIAKEAQAEHVNSPIDHALADKVSVARKGAAAEHALSPLEAIKAYRMAVFWTLMVSLTIIMEGYDTILIGNLFAFPPFAEKYGQYVDKKTGKWQLSAPWQAGLGNCAGVGAFFGTMLNGLLVDKIGQKRAIVGSLIALSGLIFITFFAPNITVLAVGELLCGLPWGVFASSAPAYASEVLPLSLRVFLTSYTNMCFIMGQLIASGVLAGCLTFNNQWSYRVPFAIQWIWPILLVPILIFAPESPWHLVRKGRLDEAEASLRRLQNSDANIDTKATLATIVHTNELEKHLTAGTKYQDCFKGVERRRTEIACVAFAAQVLAGLSFAYNSTYFFQQVGLDEDKTYKLNIGGNALALVGTFVNWFALMPYFGRRRIFLCGLFGMATVLFTIGILSVWAYKDGIGMAQASLTLVWTFIFQLSLGQLGWALPAEVGSTRLRQKTICLARNSYYILSVVAQVLQPYFLNPEEWNIKGYTGFFWFAAASLTFIWAFFRLPETKGRSYEELDWLFAKKTPTRAFSKVQVDVYGEEATKEAVI